MLATRIRPATPADAARLAPLAAETFRDGWGAVLDRAAVNAYVAAHLTQAALTSDLARDGSLYGLVVSEDDTPLGYAKLDFARAAPPELPSVSSVCLQRLYVAQAGRGTGIADALLTWATKQMQEAGRETLYLECDPRNERAWRFYEKRGFRPVVRTPYVLPTGVNDNVWILAR